MGETVLGSSKDLCYRGQQTEWQLTTQLQKEQMSS